MLGCGISDVVVAFFSLENQQQQQEKIQVDS